MFEEVGKHLQDTGKTFIAHDLVKSEAFYRSSYNRYYYSTFFIVIEELKNWVESSTDFNHSNAPEILRAKVLETINKTMKKYKRISHEETWEILGKGKSATTELCSLLEQCKAVRWKADYDLENKMIINISSVSLGGVSIDSAYNWCVKASSFIKLIKSAKREIDAL